MRSVLRGRSRRRAVVGLPVGHACRPGRSRVVRPGNRRRRQRRRDRQWRRHHARRCRAQPRPRPIVLVHLLRHAHRRSGRGGERRLLEQGPPSRTSRGMARTYRRSSRGLTTASLSPAWPRKPRSSRRRRAPSQGSASPTRWPPPCGTPGTSASTSTGRRHTLPPAGPSSRTGLRARAALDHVRAVPG